MTANTKEAPVHLWLKDLGADASVEGVYLVKDKRSGVSRKGDPYLMLVLSDKSGEIEARVWEKADSLSARFKTGDMIRLQGQVTSFKGQNQVVISDLTVAEGTVDPAIFLEASPFAVSDMIAGLREILRDMEETHTRAVIDRFMGDTEFMSRFKRAPAAKNFHHCYLGGLLEHTLAVCRLASDVCARYPSLNRDILLAGAFLHDIGKVKELSCDLQIDYTDEGRLIGHLALGASMLDEKIREIKGFPAELAIRLRHLILSHHGEYLFGSPKKPKFAEAFALHFVDDLDAKLNALGRILERDREDGSWTRYNRLLERYLLKGDIKAGEERMERKEDHPLRQGALFFMDEGM
ncbi:HD domain-containing protein [bacterium]|nr:HD domain-containing protein [bacterium]